MSTLKVDGIRSNGDTSGNNAITLADNNTCTANITNNLSNKNLVINGAMQVAQRGTSTTTSGSFCVDRFQVFHGGTDEAPTFSQADIVAGTTPYTLGFRKSLKVTNGNQTGGAGAGDYVWIQNKYEAQDIANSGWNYKSSSSYITLSFWVKSSVPQNFYGAFETLDAPEYLYPFETGTLSQDTWTKITKTIPGNSNLVFNNDNEVGLNINILPFLGTDFTASGVSLNTWALYGSGTTRTPDNTSTWYTTNDATFEITGVQLEVGSVATDFEHRSFADELRRCQRYYYQYYTGTEDGYYFYQYVSSNRMMDIQHPVPMRTDPTPTISYNSGTATPYHSSELNYKAYNGLSSSDGSVMHTEGTVKFSAEL